MKQERDVNELMGLVEAWRGGGAARAAWPRQGDAVSQVLAGERCGGRGEAKPLPVWAELTADGGRASRVAVTKPPAGADPRPGRETRRGAPEAEAAESEAWRPERAAAPVLSARPRQRGQGPAGLRVNAGGVVRRLEGRD
jgi:hypothetical protein